MGTNMADDPVLQCVDGAVSTGDSGSAILDRIDGVLHRYCVLPGEDEYKAVTLWVAYTHFIEAFDSAPRLVVRSPHKRSGKTRLLEVVAEMVYHPLRAMNVSTAYLFRSLHEQDRTLLLDEVDALFGTTVKAVQNEDLRAILNAGFQRGNPVGRISGPNLQPVEYSTFAPVAMAGIGDLPDTIEDRAVIIRMRRRTGSETVKPYRMNRDSGVLRQLRDELHAWAKTRETDAWERANADNRVVLPVDDRAADVWEPLIVVADLAGGLWPALGRAACLALTLRAAEQDTATTPGQQLLADVREVFTGEFIKSDELCAALRALPESPWDAIDLTPTKLGKRLGVYEITTGHTPDKKARIYRRADFLDAFARYLPPQPRPTPSTPSGTGTDQQKPVDTHGVDAA